ncbi:recombinase family protein [Nocardioides marmoraquaticus]
MATSTPQAALYARMERADASARAGIDLQLSVCALAARQRGLEVVDRVTDLAASGRHLLRPGMQHLLSSIMERRIDAVVVTGVAQLTYRAADWRFIEDLFDRSGVCLFTVLPSQPHGSRRGAS